MPRGYPDYFGQSIFMKYGSAQRAAYDGYVTANTENNIITISGKGRLYGGYLYTDQGTNQKNDRVRVYVDGVMIFSLMWEGLYTQNTTTGTPSPVSLTRYDIGSQGFAMVFGGNITFDSELKITYGEYGGYTPRVGSEIYYALIT